MSYDIKKFLLFTSSFCLMHRNSNVFKGEANIMNAQTGMKGSNNRVEENNNCARASSKMLMS